MLGLCDFAVQVAPAQCLHPVAALNFQNEFPLLTPPAFLLPFCLGCPSASLVTPPPWYCYPKAGVL